VIALRLFLKEPDLEPLDPTETGDLEGIFGLVGEGTRGDRGGERFAVTERGK